MVIIISILFLAFALWGFFDFAEKHGGSGGANPFKRLR